MVGKVFVGAYRVLLLLLHISFNLLKLWLLMAAIFIGIAAAAGLGGDGAGAGAFTTIAAVIAIFSPLLVMLAFHILSLRRLRRREERFSPVGYYTRRAATHSAVIFMIMPIISASFLLLFSDQIEAKVPGSKIDTASEVFLFTIENIAKVILFDLVEIFGWDVSNVVPATTTTKILVFLYRTAISVTIARYLATILNFDEYPIGGRREAAA